MQTVSGVAQCRSCAAPLTGKYCAACGEKTLHRHDLSLRHYIEESFEGLTHFDNKFFRTMKLLLLQPGQLTAHFFEGRRMPFMKPFQLFIVMNLLFFLVAKSNLFSIGLYNYLNYEPYKSMAMVQDLANQRLTAAQMDTVALLFNERVVTQSKAFIILFLPLYALVCALLFIHKKRTIVTHLVFTTHFFCFVLVYFLLFHIVVEQVVHKLLNTDYSMVLDEVFGMVHLLGFLVYFAIAAKRFYKVHTAYAITTGIIVAGLFFFVLMAYRMFLFYKIIHSIQI